MEVRGAAASDFEVEVQGDDRRGIGVARWSLISDTPSLAMPADRQLRG